MMMTTRKTTVSIVAKRTTNPIRDVVDRMTVQPNPDKKLIPLSIGDPTTFGNLNTPTVFMDALCKAARDPSTHGYQNSVGTPAARRAVAKHYSTPTAPLTENDVIMASGCSGALELAFKALVDEGDNVLAPCPGFALYRTIVEGIGGTCKTYPLIPELDWQADLQKMKAMADSRTKAIVVNNPSNPCGSVYSKEHLIDILKVAQELGIPVIADEIYRGLTFSGAVFHAMADLTADVPVISVGGIAKEYLVPGFRVGWILINDRHNLFANLRGALVSLSQVILGPNSLVLSALPSIMDPEPASAEDLALIAFRKHTVSTLEKNALFVTDRLSGIEGLQVIVPQGAMYVMVGINPSAGFDFKNDMDFCERLLSEESVFCLPGTCFDIPNYFRVVFCAPDEILEEACDRLKAFCARHRAGTAVASN
jgi:tyrosine aminotransferase